MKIDERHLLQIVAVVICGGVTEAASMLGLAQPTISRNIAYVENRLGESLFIKGKRPLHPTLLGQLLALHGQVIMEVSRKASESAQSFQEGSAGGVRVCGGRISWTR